MAFLINSEQLYPPKKKKKYLYDLNWMMTVIEI